MRTRVRRRPSTADARPPSRVMMSPESRTAVMQRLPFVRAPRLPDSSPELRQVIKETFPVAHMLRGAKSPATQSTAASFPEHCQLWAAREEMTPLQLPKRQSSSTLVSNGKQVTLSTSLHPQDPGEQLRGSPSNFPSRICELLPCPTRGSACPSRPFTSPEAPEQPVQLSPCQRPRFGRSTHGWVPPS